MIVNWSTQPPQQHKSPSWQSWLKGWQRQMPGSGPQSPAVPPQWPGSSGRVIRGQMHASLQYDGLLPVSEISVTGTRYMPKIESCMLVCTQYA